MTQPRNVVRLDPDLADLIGPYLASRRQNLEAMTSALGTADWGTLASLAHKILGTAGSYGFHELSTIGGALEDAAIARDELGVRRGLIRYSDYLTTLVVTYAAA